MQRINKIEKSITRSATLMTMFSLVSKPLIFIILTPLILTRFDTSEIALWYLLASFISFQGLADFGFYNTFVRVIGLAISGGCQRLEDYYKIEDVDRKTDKPNLDLCGDIVATMRSIYSVLLCISFTVMICCTPLLFKTVNSLDNPIEGWISWTIVILGTLINYSSRKYTNFMLAQNEVALVRRWEGVLSLCAFTSNVAIIIFMKSLPVMILSNQVWLLLGLILYKHFANSKVLYKYDSFRNFSYSSDVFRMVWPLAWKSGVSTLCSQGVAIATGLVYAQIASSLQLSIYLLSIRIADTIKSFALAPFYSKIPYMVILRGKNNLIEWLNLSQRGMFYASSLIVSGFIFFDLFGDVIFDMFHSKVPFANHILWLLISMAYIIQRYGAMHTQLYMTLNKVNSHINDFISSLIMISIWFALFKHVGVYTFPIGMIVAYCFYSVYAVFYSRKVILVNLIEYEKKANIIPLCTFLIYTVMTVFMLN